MGPSRRRRLSGSGGGRRAGLAGHAGLSARCLGDKRHARLPVDDGPAAEGTAPGAETDRQHLSALRSHGQPLSEDADGCGVRAAAVSQRDCLEADERPKVTQAILAAIHDVDPVLRQDETHTWTASCNRRTMPELPRARHHYEDPTARQYQPIRSDRRRQRPAEMRQAVARV